MSGRYKVEIKDIIEHQYIPLEKKKVYEANGYMVINEDYSTIDAMEKTKEGKMNICNWKRRHLR